jgi:alginate O-acetyltransferase complex protein AlgI
MDIWDSLRSFLAYDPERPMLLQTTGFFIVFSFFYAIYSSLNSEKIRTRNGLLLFFGLFFYYKLSGWFVLVLCGLAFCDYYMAITSARASRSRDKNLLLLLSVSLNIGLLFYFKYTNFFIGLYNVFASTNPVEPLAILQPIGISYFVFKSLTYSIDIHREVIEEPERNYFRYLLYVSYFPNILAGPITKARDLLPSFNSTVSITRDIISQSVLIISIGLIKKIAVADYLAANLTDRLFESPQFFSSFELFIGAFAGLFRLYFDFAGYTDLVVGLSLMMGYPIKGNFNQPFKAENITGFWKRWHITLYDWLNEYVYQPVAFHLRHLKLKGVILAVFATFLISGIWHGANLTFILWGVLHGIAICFEIATAGMRKKIAAIGGKSYKVFSVVATLLFLALTSVLINSSDINSAFGYWAKILSGIDFTLFSDWFSIYQWPAMVLIIAVFSQYLPVRFYTLLSKQITRLSMWLLGLGFAFLVWVLYQLVQTEAISFIYIEF